MFCPLGCTPAHVERLGGEKVQALQTARLNGWFEFMAVLSNCAEHLNNLLLEAQVNKTPWPKLSPNLEEIPRLIRATVTKCPAYSLPFR